MTPNQPNDPESSGSLRLVTFGDASLIRVPVDGEPEEILGPGKPLCLLIYLAFSPERSATRDHLIDLLWANLDLDSARHALRQALWYLRKNLGDNVIRSRGPELQLSVPLEADRDRFMDAIEDRDFERAVDLYRGEFLPMFAAPGGADFEKWADTERYRLKTHFLRAARTVVQARLARGEFQEARELAARARDADPLNQNVWRLLLETLLAAGDVVRARIEGHALEERLDELNREPEPPLRRLLDAAREGFEEPSPVPAGDALRPELVGREQEFATVLAAWNEARTGHGGHLHLRGSAGLGKSRLLVEIDARLKTMGVRRVLVRAHPGEREIRCALASDLAAALAELPGSRDISDGAARVLVALNPELTDRYSVAPDESTGEEALRRRAVALKTLVAAVAGPEPVAVLIDDVHWADTKSRQLLGSLCEKLGETRALIVTTARPAGGSRLFSNHPAQQLELQPLSDEEVRRVLVSLATLPNERWAENLPGALQAATGGSPLLVLETLRLGLSEGWLSLEEGEWECRDPESLDAELAEGRALHRRVESLPDSVFRLLLLLSVAGRPLSAEHLASATETSLKSVSGKLRKLEVDGLVACVGNVWMVAHDEIAGVVLETVNEGRLEESHRMLGRMLAGSSAGDPENLLRAGRHLAKARDLDALQQVFTRWVTAVRERRDGRPLDDLVGDFLPAPEKDTEVARRIGDLSLGTRLRLAPRKSHMAVTAAAVVSVLIVVAALTTGGAPTPDAELLVLRSSARGGMDGFRLPVSRQRWEDRGRLDLEEDAEPIPELQGLPRTTSVLPAPLGRGWAYAAVAPDSGETEVFFKSAQGQVRRLTHSPGDDEPRSWAPDGSSLVFQTSRWGGNPWHDLAILDLESGRIRPLVRGGGEKDGFEREKADAAWSPDGTRIAFLRQFLAARPTPEVKIPEDELCWTVVDGTTQRCLIPDSQIRELIGWNDTWQIVAVVEDNDGGGRLELIDLRTGESDVIDSQTDQAAVSPDGQWLASFRRASSGTTQGWYVGPLERPDLALPLQADADARLALLHWSFTGSADESPYLSALEIQAPDTVTLGVPVRLRVRAVDSRGSPVVVPVLTWGLGESERATLNPETGVLRPEETAELTIHASAGGWRRDTVRLSVRPPSAEMRLSEGWEGELTTNWVPFGEPFPTLARWPGGGRAYWNRSSDAYHSGIYSRREFSAERGLGLEATLSTRRTAARAQDLNVSLKAWTEPEAVSGWDHRTGSGPAAAMSCYFRYPASDGFENLHRARVHDSREVDVDSIVPTGDPYTLRLQLFPDRTCGVAIDGEPLARVDVRPPLDVPHRVVIAGKSMKTKLLVDDIEVWEGVRADVDWSALESW